MNYAKMCALVVFAGLISVALMPTLQADTWDKKTVLTVNEPIQLPTLVLQPGTYVFKLMNSQADRHIVQVFDKEDQHLITTILAIPNERMRRTGKTEFQYWEVPAGQPKALRAWFYPGDVIGDEFAYPKHMATQIASYSKTTVPSTESTSELSKATVSTVDESGSTKEIEKTTVQAEAAPPAPAPVPVTAEPTPQTSPVVVAQNEPPATPAPVRTETRPMPATLPHTASIMPLVGLVGLLSLAAFAGIRGRQV